MSGELKTPSNAAPNGFKLACIGDVMPASVDMAGQTSPECLRKGIWKPLEGVDAILLNLETPITSSTEAHRNKRYCFRSSTGVLDLFDHRFVFGLANNHIFDYGEKGLLDTIDALDTRHFPHAGAGRNLDSAGAVEIKISGAHLGIVCAADARYQSATRTSAGTFPAIPGLLREAVADLRRRGAIAIVSIHSGQEFLPAPSPQQRFLADLCMEEGARVVSFHHAHCVSGWRQDSQGIVLFGTGNYLFPPGDTPSCYSDFRKSAAWRITMDPLQPGSERLEIRPILMDRNGLPCEATKMDAVEILRRIARYSDRIRSSRLGWWRAREMVRPVYLWMNAVNYADIARRNGLRVLVRLLIEGIRAQRQERQHE